MQTNFTKMMGIDYPIIMAPMFLVSNTKMIIAGLENGITGAIPALNYRTDKELQSAITEIKQKTNKPFGINLIVNKSNLKYKNQLQTCIDLKVDYIITSLGSPQETIEQCKKYGIKVFCDVTDLAYAKKVEAVGADAVIAVNSDAGGHAGNIKESDLIPLLKQNINIPIISAGNIASKQHIENSIKLGADAVSIGTMFIATNESPVSEEYKNALITYKAKDIVKTTKLSGSALTVINTPYVQTIGTKASFLEKILNKNKRLKKWFKLFIALKGMKKIEKAAFGASYQTVWCAGPSIEYINEIKPVKDVINSLTISK